MNNLQLLLNYVISFSSVMLILVYLVDLPFLVTRKREIVNEYYIKNLKTNIPLDFIFVFLYFLVAEIASYYLKIKTKNKIFVVGVVTAILTSGFCYYFTSRPLDKKNFFSRWFNTVGYSSAIYDVILLMAIYYIYINTKVTFLN